MKIKAHILFMLVCLTANIIADDVDVKINKPEKSVRGCRGWGFFADFLWVLNHLEYCITSNKTPVIYWGPNFAYYTPNGYNKSTNCWEYYFEPVSNLSYEKKDIIQSDLHYKDNFSVIWNYFQYVVNINLCAEATKHTFNFVSNVPVKISPHKYPFGTKHLYDHEFRNFVKTELIDRFIKIKPSIQQKIDDFYQTKMLGKKTIGIHLRGKFLGNEVTYIPTAVIAHIANQYAQSSNYQFYIATDQEPLIKEAEKLLAGKVIYYQCDRFASTTSPIAGKQKLHPKLGEDVLIETILLSKCDFFIHTISNVSTTALYFNPDLDHLVLY